MAVTSAVSRVEYVGNGVTTSFGTTFVFLANSEVVVWTSTDNVVWTPKTLGVDYTMSGDNVVFTVAPANGLYIRIERTVPWTQEVDFRGQGNFSPDVHEDAFDEACFRDQQLLRRVLALEAQGNNVGDALAGAGLSVSGETWNVGAGSGITVNADDVAVNFGGAPADVTKASASAGAASTVSRSDHKHNISTAAPASGAVAVGNSASEGSATSLARSDHQHAVSAGTPVAVDKSANAAGSAATFARSDHKHDVTTAAAAELTDSTNAEGSASSLARSDHTHGHGNRGGGSLHAVATSGAAGFESAADKTIFDHYFGEAFSGTADTSDATPAVAASYAVTDGKVVVVEVTVTGRQSGGGNGAGYQLVGTFRRDGASVVQIGATTVVASHEDVAGWNCALVASGSNVQVQVTGAAATTISWRARGRVVVS